ncbi:MAG: cupin domain-containing protein [Oscillospiraceae bacterium]|jgi:predicted cupin superfamily sugar epimerase|nr:cupin domain-containing protein [Oscillospiraceae bacterium]
MQHITPEQIKAHFHMIPLQGEGGVFCQTYISDEILPGAVIPGRDGEHTICSAILYLLSGNTFSRMHRLPSEEIFHFYMGDPVEMLQLYPDGTGRVVRMGQNILDGETVQTTVPRGAWQGTRLVPGGKWALLGTCMAPGYCARDYEDGDLKKLLAQYPAHAELLRVLAGPPSYS